MVIGPRCYVGPFASLRGDFGRILVGEGSNVQDSCVVHAFPGADAVLEPGSHVGHGAVLHGCRIHTHALIGIGAVVLDGAEVGENSLVGAGALVPADTTIPPRSLALGSPAKVVRPLDEVTLDWKVNGVRVYQDLARRSLASLRETAPLPEEEPDRPRVSTGDDVSVPLHEQRRRSE